jgi:transposase-like protein
MPGKRMTPEQIIGVLRQEEVELAQGRTVGEVCRGLGVSEASFYRWRTEYGGLKVDQARRMKELERENARLKRAVARPRRKPSCRGRLGPHTLRFGTPTRARRHVGHLSHDPWILVRGQATGSLARHTRGPERRPSFLRPAIRPARRRVAQPCLQGCH